MEARTLVLMGRTGNGKSSTGNSIVGRNVFKVGLSFTSVTKECQLEQTNWKDGRIINVIDTPGLFDTNSTNSKEFIQSQIVKCIDLANGVVHGVLYVVSVNNRFTAEEASVLDSLQLLFGPDIINYMVVVFTGGDDLENSGVTLEDYLKDSTPLLEGVLRRCNMRKVLFDNKTTSQSKKETQTTALMKEIDSIIAENGGRPFSYELLRQAQDNREKLDGGETCHIRSGTCCHEDELGKENAEHTKQFNPTRSINAAPCYLMSCTLDHSSERPEVKEKISERGKIYDDRSKQNDEILRKEIEQDALELTKQIQKMGERCPLQEFCQKACEACSHAGCTIL